MTKTKSYKTRRDMELKGRFWPTGIVRRLTDEEAKPLLEAGRIYLVDKSPKQLVKLIEADGTSKIITWGEYLRQRKEAGRRRA